MIFDLLSLIQLSILEFNKLIKNLSVHTFFLGKIGSKFFKNVHFNFTYIQNQPFFKLYIFNFDGHYEPFEFFILRIKHL